MGQMHTTASVDAAHEDEREFATESRRDVDDKSDAGSQRTNSCPVSAKDPGITAQVSIKVPERL
jgi:hypothetical protein